MGMISNGIELAIAGDSECSEMGLSEGYPQIHGVIIMFQTKWL